MTLPNRQQYEALVREVWFHNKRYFVDNDPDISDEAFDRLMWNLHQIEKEHPDWILPDSPTQRVGESVTEGFSTVVHDVPMLSLANVYSLEELKEFLVRMVKLVGRAELNYSAELKMDGVAITAHYDHGRFVRAVSRGDGWKGDEITANLKTIQRLPLQLVGESIPAQLEVRGEVYMPKAAFSALNEERRVRGEPLFANPRNAASGSLKLLDPVQAAERRLDVVFYSIAEETLSTIPSQFQLHAFLRGLGLPTLSEIALCHSLDEVLRFIVEVERRRPELPFEIDGVVLKLDDRKQQHRLGNTGKNPRWAVAYKFAAQQAITRVSDISVQVGRTGVLTPVAELEPVPLAGSTIARATLHNEDEVRRKDIRVGDWVVIEKGGDVIPKVVKVVLERRDDTSVAWAMPSRCPVCGTPVIRLEGEVATRCPNIYCAAQRVRRLIFFASKHAFDIEHLGEKVVTQLVDKGYVKQPADFFSLTSQELSQLEGFKEKSVQNVLESLDRARQISLAQLIMSLGIPHIGAETAEELAQHFKTIDVLKRATRDELLRIFGIGDVVAGAIVDYFADSLNSSELERLLKVIVVEPVPERRSSGHLFEGKTFVLTGTLDSMTREEAAELIKERGGKVSSSVSRKTYFLVTGHEAGSKLAKAQELGVEVLTEQRFQELLSGS